MAKISYTEEQIDAYIDLAQEIGHGPARRELGYPKTWQTGSRWATARGVKIDVDELRKRATETKKFYDASEQLVIAEALQQRILDAIENDTLDPEELNRLSNALHKAVQTHELLRGQATDRRENVEVTQQDLELRELIAQQEAKNQQEADQLEEANTAGEG